MPVVKPPWGIRLSFWERLLIRFRLDPQGRRRPPVPSSAHYSHIAIKGKVHETSEIRTVDDGSEVTGTRVMLSTIGGLIPVELKGFRAPAGQGDWVEIFFAKIQNVDVPYPIYFHNKATDALTEIEHTIWRCAATNGSTEDWAIALLKREVRYFAYEHSGVTA